MYVQEKKKMQNETEQNGRIIQLVSKDLFLQESIEDGVLYHLVQIF